MRTAQDFMVEIPVLKHTDQMTKARQILRDDRFREVYVVDAKKNLLGYIDITDGLRVTATKSNITIEGFVREAPRALPEDPIEQVAKAMRTVSVLTVPPSWTVSRISWAGSSSRTCSRSSSPGTSCTARYPGR